MARLNNRNMQIPNGLTFYVPELNWRPRQFSSFDGIVDALYHLILANPPLQAKYPTDKTAVADMVDEYNAAICAQNGWSEYIGRPQQDAPIPKGSPQRQQALLQNLRSAAAKAKELVAGAKALGEWVDSGEPAVPSEQSASRAAICADCPQNEMGDFTKWFTVPAAELIRKRLEVLHSRQLSTPDDERINICSACSCPSRLKVHTPIAYIVKSLSAEQRERLKQGKNCWILSEAP
jgi:hypothetical protein